VAAAPPAAVAGAERNAATAKRVPATAAHRASPVAPGAAEADPWSRLPGILARIRPPVFPARDFLLTAFGAVPDGETDASAAFRAAIDACQRAGGGRVVVPAGVFLTGPIQLRSRVNLHVSSGATIRFSRDPERYLPVVLTRFEGVELMGYSPLVYAFEQQDIAITGEGTLDGQAGPEHWWPWKSNDHPRSQKGDRDRLFRQAEEGVPVAERRFGAGHSLRPQFIQPYRCANVLVEGVTVTNAPMWLIHPVLSRNVIVRGVKIVSAGPNSDGCDPESSSDVLIEDSLFDTGDDCIAIKSGRNADGRRLATPSERIVVRGCRMRAGHGGVTIGSEVSGGVRDVFVERCVMSSPALERGIRIKTNAMRGGVVENVFVRDVEIGEVGSAIDIDMLYEEGAAGSFTPVVRNVLVERLTVERAAHALFVRGLATSPVRGLVVRDSSFRSVANGSLLSGVADLLLRDVVIQPGRPEETRKEPR
jgi:polygalacturonase